VVKRLFSIAVVVALFSGLAMAQVRSEEVRIDGPGVATAQAGPPGGFEDGPQARFFHMRVRGPMGQGRDVMYHAVGMGSWWMNPEVAERIGLSDQQKQELEKISQDGRLKMIGLRADLEKQQVILVPLLQAYHPDEAQVLAQVDKVSQARAAVERARVQTMLASRNVLTEEQWKRIHDTRTEFHRTFRQRGFRRSGGPPKPAQPPSK